MEVEIRLLPLLLTGKGSGGGEGGGEEVESDYKPQALFPSDLLPLA